MLHKHVLNVYCFSSYSWVRPPLLPPHHVVSTFLFHDFPALIPHSFTLLLSLCFPHFDRLWKHSSKHGRREDLLHPLCHIWHPSLWLLVGGDRRPAGHHLREKHLESWEDIQGELQFTMNLHFLCLCALKFLVITCVTNVVKVLLSKLACLSVCWFNLVVKCGFISKWFVRL